jgi:hypothetical protein
MENCDDHDGLVNDDNDDFCRILKRKFGMMAEFHQLSQSSAAPAHLTSIHQKLVDDHKEGIFLIRVNKEGSSPCRKASMLRCVRYYISLVFIRQIGINLALKGDK